MDDELEHRPSATRRNRRSHCRRCGMLWPCLAAQERVLEIARAKKRGHGPVRCRQCEREVDITRFSVEQGRCRDCVSAGVMLSRHWKLMGIPIRQRRH
jgi:hypothetical protein